MKKRPFYLFVLGRFNINFSENEFLNYLYSLHVYCTLKKVFNFFPYYYLNYVECKNVLGLKIYFVLKFQAGDPLCIQLWCDWSIICIRTYICTHCTHTYQMTVACPRIFNGGGGMLSAIIHLNELWW